MGTIPSSNLKLQSQCIPAAPLQAFIHPLTHFRSQALNPNTHSLWEPFMHSLSPNTEPHTNLDPGHQLVYQNMMMRMMMLLSLLAGGYESI